MAGRSTTARAAFASASLVALMVRAMPRLGTGLLPDQVSAPDELAGATLPAFEKRELAAHVYRQGGAMPLLRVGEFIGEGRNTPALAMMLKSQNTDVLAQKWMRLERYHHSTHRVAIDCGTAGQWDCRRVNTPADLPTDAENLLICGLLRGLLQLFGCKEVTAEIGGLRIGAATGNPRPTVRAAESTLSWRLHWAKSPSPPTRPMPEGPSPGTTDIVDHVARLLDDDVGRVWKLDEAARALGRSSRTLQRAIRSTGHTFSSLVRGSRTRQACRLLMQARMPLVDIGYSCGYADQAHFQRDFRRAVNMTPNDYRRIANAP